MTMAAKVQHIRNSQATQSDLALMMRMTARVQMILPYT